MVASSDNYPFAFRNPYIRAIRRLMVGVFIISSAALLTVAGIGIGSRKSAFWTEGFAIVLLAACLAGLWLWGKSRVVVLSEKVVVKGVISRQEYPWRDVRTVSLESWVTGGALRRLYGRLMYWGEATTPYVDIGLSRAARVSLLPRRVDAGTRVKGPSIPTVRHVRLYLQDGDSFVREAQLHLDLPS